ncbi:MAG: hypothetical protein IPG08_09890, partial [Sphingobacteriaceae bacterium]|nr:hypothetical protein [Sphingobacteriaceae bacterium]
TIQQAAIRECEEECAVTGLTILKQLPDTYHIYEYKTGHALKRFLISFMWKPAATKNLNHKRKRILKK